MTFQVIFSVEGNPQGKARARFTKTGRAYTPKKTVDYENEIAIKAKQAMGSSEPLKTAVAVYVYANYKVPASYSKQRRSDCLAGVERPKVNDIDNVCKSVLDGMNNVVYVDDKQVVSLHATKRFDTIESVHVLVKEELM